jgi:hypothetical protein
VRGDRGRVQARGRRGLARCGPIGCDIPRPGALLAAGGTLTEVGELLGHSTAQVTMTYASFDLTSLAVLARPWPAEVDDV